MPLKKLLGVSVIAATLAACSLQPAHQPMVEAWEQGEPAPVMSAQMPELDLQTAYQLQAQAVRQRLGNVRPDGFKAGLTSAPGQQKFGVNEPVAGVLWPGSALIATTAEVCVLKEEFNKPMLELELAFRLGQSISAPVKDIQQLQAMVIEVMPAIELPDLGFAAGAKLTGPDIVAANVAASRYILGSPVPVEQADVNAVYASLSRDGERLQKAAATAVMGNQWRALLWLVNQRIASGWTLEAGQVLLTGAMGPMLALEQGAYEANFGGLGEVRFSVK